MEDLVKSLSGEFFVFGLILLIVAVFLRTKPIVVKFIIAGAVLAAIGEWMYFQGEESLYHSEYGVAPVEWVRASAFLLWALAVIFGWFGREGKASSVKSHDNDIALPDVAIKDENFVHNAESAREQIVDWFEYQAKEKGIRIQSVATQPYVPNPQVLIEIRNPAEQESEVEHVTSAKITINSKPFFRFEQLYDIEINNGVKQKAYVGVTQLRETDVVTLLAVLSGKMKLNEYSPKCVRRWFFQILRPKNRLVGCRLTPKFSEKLFLFFAAFIPFLFLFYRKKPTYRLSTGKPEQEPRSLVRMDSWQTVIEKVGYAGESLRNEIRNKLLESLPREIQANQERIWYWGPNGKVQREQIVVRLRRAVAFVHIYSYGEDLYVGWDAHVNSGSWQEYLVAKGYSKKQALPVELYAVEPTWHQPNEYDVYDANFIIEAIHALMTRIVRRVVKEFKIDQEIDFNIVRESRKDVTNTSEPSKGNKKKQFARTG